MLHIKSFEFSPIQENTYVLYNEFKECIVIDPGCYFDEEKERLASFISEMNLKPIMLLNTHCHLDHVFGNKFITEKYKLTLHIHANEKAVLDFAPASGLMYNMPFDNYQGEINYLEVDSEILVGSDKLKILFTPGHSPGSLSFYSEADGFVISGDALFYRSIGRTDLPGGNHKQLLESIRKNLFILPAETKVFSGHGPVTKIGEEKELNPFLND
ncbi:MAG: MBL fold metallo-hydrolase [Ferruginibacter sp.]